MDAGEISTNIEHSEFALKLRKYRKESGLSYDDIAAQFGISLERLALLELSRVTPTAREKRRLEKYLSKQKAASPK